jgi:hypothetical protein
MKFVLGTARAIDDGLSRSPAMVSGGPQPRR